VHYVASTGDVSEAVGQAQGAVLKFRSEGVTNVLFTETNAWLSGAFGIEASSQHYYPRYGYNSDEPLTNIVSNVPADELVGSMFIGWNPSQDTTRAADLGSRGRACLAFMAHAGQPTNTGNEKSGALSICETVDYLCAAVSAGGTAVSRASFLAGAARIGSSYSPVATFAIRASASRHDGVAAIRDGMFNSSCKCFAYTSAPHAATS